MLALLPMAGALAAQEENSQPELLRATGEASVEPMVVEVSEEEYR
jgi:hypothetical protein